MFRKLTASIAAAAAIVGIAAGSANASPRHSDIYVKTVAGAWVAEDQLTAAQINALDNETNCAPVQTAVLVDQPAYIGGFPVPVIETVGGRSLVALSDATVVQISAANFNQAGLTGVPSWLGPTSYNVAYSSTGAPIYSC